MGKSIEKIKCPILNNDKTRVDTGNLEVFILFEHPHPIAIMCSEYNSTKKECSLKHTNCIYQKWDYFSKKEPDDIPTEYK